MKTGIVPWIVKQRSLLGVVFFGVLTVFWGIGKKSLWLDEALSLSIVTNWQHLWSIAAKTEPYQWSYLVLLYIWKNAGAGEAYLRSLSAVFAIATIPVVYALGRLLFDRRIGLLAAFLLVINVFFVRYGQEIRGSSMLLFFTAFSSYCFVRYLRGKQKSWLIGYILTSIIAFYTHHFAIFTLVGQYISLLWFPASKEKRVLIASLPFILLGILPLARIPIPPNAINWISKPTGADFIRFFVIIAGGHPLLLVISGVAILSFLIRRAWGDKGNRGWNMVYVFLLLIIPIGGAFLLSFFLTPMFVPRYLIATLVPWNIAFALGVMSLPKNWRIVSVTAISLLSLLSLLTWYRGQDTVLPGFVYTDKEDWRGTAEYVISHAKSGDGIIFYAYFTEVPFSYYARGVVSPKIIQISSAPYTIGGVLPPPNDMLLRSLPQTYARIWFVQSHDRSPVLLRDAQSGYIQNVLRQEYPLYETKEFSGISLTIYGNP